MPTTRRRRQYEEDESDSDSSEDNNPIVIKMDPPQKPLLATPWGSDQWFDMCKQTGKDLTCSICLESCLECKNCLALLVPCLHSVHYRCLFQMEKMECPMCRPSNSTNP